MFAARVVVEDREEEAVLLEAQAADGRVAARPNHHSRGVHGPLEELVKRGPLAMLRTGFLT